MLENLIVSQAGPMSRYCWHIQSTLFRGIVLGLPLSLYNVFACYATIM